MWGIWKLFARKCLAQFVGRWPILPLLLEFNCSISNGNIFKFLPTQMWTRGIFSIAQLLYFYCRKVSFLLSKNLNVVSSLNLRRWIAVPEPGLPAVKYIIAMVKSNYLEQWFLGHFCGIEIYHRKCILKLKHKHFLLNLNIIQRWKHSVQLIDINRSVRFFIWEIISLAPHRKEWAKIIFCCSETD